MWWEAFVFFQNMSLYFSSELFGIEHVSLLDDVSRRSLRNYDSVWDYSRFSQVMYFILGKPQSASNWILEVFEVGSFSSKKQKQLLLHVLHGPAEGYLSK